MSLRTILCRHKVKRVTYPIGSVGKATRIYCPKCSHVFHIRSYAYFLNRRITILDFSPPKYKGKLLLLSPKDFMGMRY